MTGMLPDRQSLGDLEFFVIDVLRHDIEDEAAIRRMLNSRSELGWRDYWPRDFTCEEVRGALEKLVLLDLVLPLEYDPQCKRLADMKRPFDLSNLEDLWFKLEEPARDLWDAWNAPSKIES